MLRLGIYLIAIGLVPVLGLGGGLPWGLFLHLLAIAAGAAILLRRQADRGAAWCILNAS